jgi:hypothetical protein
MDFFQSHQTVPKRCYLTFFHIPERSIALVKRLAGSQRAEIDPYANKVLLKVAHAFLYTLMDFFQSHKLCPSRCYLTFFHIPTFNCTSKTTGWFTKGLKLIPTCPTLTKCYSKVAHAFLYTLMDFFQSHQTVPKPLLSYLLPYSNVQLH